MEQSIMMKGHLVAIEKVRKWFPVYRGRLLGISGYVKAVDGVSFSVRQKDTFGLVGESGCGKTTLAKMVIRLLEPTSGAIYFGGENIIEATGPQLRNFRRHAQIVFQDPYSSLNPRMRIEQIVGEPLEAHNVRNKDQRRRIVKDMIKEVGLSEDVLLKFPHQFSGGQRQRIAIARALVTNPSLVVLDEPTSALDVSIRSQIVNLLRRLQDKFGLTYIVISHDLSLIRHICNRVGVMYLGRLLEIADSSLLYENPAHPYTKALLSAIPSLSLEGSSKRIILEGDVPDPVSPPAGCLFHTRCQSAFAKCYSDEPSMTQLSSDHSVCCHLCQ